MTIQKHNIDYVTSVEYLFFIRMQSKLALLIKPQMNRVAKATSKPLISCVQNSILALPRRFQPR